jgi:hypothetical protein
VGILVESANFDNVLDYYNTSLTATHFSSYINAYFHFFMLYFITLVDFHFLIYAIFGTGIDKFFVNLASRVMIVESS